MDRTALLNKLNEILREILEIDDLQITETTVADDVEDWDSINHVRFLVAIEEELGFQFSTREVGGIENVGQLLDLVQAKLAEVAP